jgi:hypothetical protein
MMCRLRGSRNIYNISLGKLSGQRTLHKDDHQRLILNWLCEMHVVVK